ncbi:MAG: acyl-CoA dehydrogenase family protein [Bradyrhizobiaceae bacterium]|nr:acyl-CoA dehydrogenase family protein [Bradyrhizobiaceae bacterium]
MTFVSKHRSPWMNEELDILRQTAKRFFEHHVAPLDAEARRKHGIGPEVWLKAGEMGLLGMSIPEDLGGHGGTFAHEAVVIEEQAYACNTSFGFVPGAFNAPAVFINTATREQALKWTPDIVAGKVILAVGITEPNMGSDMKALRTRAVRQGDKYIINGAKTFMTHGQQANVCLLAARTSDEGAKGISLFLIETKKTPGFNVAKVLDKIGQNGLDTCEVFLDNVEVPAKNLIGGVEGKGFGQLIDVFIKERLSIAVFAIASAERAVEMTIEHAKTRKMFGQTLWDFQNTRIKLAECASEARVGRAYIDSLILRILNGGEVTMADAATAKWWCSQKQCEIVDECLQLFGGYGYMAEYPIAQLFMDARVQKIYGGANEVMKELVARNL